MSYNINLGIWNSVFAVPTQLVDKHLRIASGNQIKVLLYFLRNSEKNLTDNQIGEELKISSDEVENALLFWVGAGLISKDGNNFTPIKSYETTSESSYTQPIQVKENKLRPMSRPQKPDNFYVSRLLQSNSQLLALMDEAQMVLGKTLSSGDTATLVMLYETDGLPVDVLLMLMQYCVSIGKGNMRTIERIGAQWASRGIITVQDVEEEIKRLKDSNDAWNKVSKIFGIKNIGSPTEKQIEYANTWINEWKFSSEMIREAYERCVDSKGEYNLRYINGILKKWFEQGFFNLNDLNNSAKPSATSKAKTKKSGEESPSYDIKQLEKYSMFDD